MYKSTSNIWGFHHLEGDWLIEGGLSSETHGIQPKRLRYKRDIVGKVWEYHHTLGS